jgi:hypothetical protein
LKRRIEGGSMDEQEWLECKRVSTMLAFLNGQVSDRKQQLFACACCHLVWSLLSDRYRVLLEAMERYADGQASSAEMWELFHAWEPSHAGAARLTGGIQAAEAVGHLGGAWRRSRNAGAGGWQGWSTADRVARCAAEALAKSIPWEQARALEVQLLHDVFGNPFRPVPVNSAWLAWNSSLVTRLAQAAYDNRQKPFDFLAPARLGILADALEEAGCDDAAILEHLRSPGPHYRGCFLLDALLGKA